MKIIFILSFLFLFAACSSRSVLPEASEVKISRASPPKDCENLGRVTGTTMTAQGKSEEALKDMQQEAANKGATYVKVEQYSGQGTSVTGIAYRCP